MKFTSYQQFKNATDEELIDNDPDEYTDEEFITMMMWFKKLYQEMANDEDLIGMSADSIWWYGLDNKYILNKVIAKSSSEFNINGKTIKGREIITYPEFSIIKEDGKNNFYRIFK